MVAPPGARNASANRMMKPQIPPASGADGARAASRQLAAISEKAKDYARNSRAENTQRAYESYDFRLSDSRQRDSFPESKQLRFVAMNREGANYDDDSRAFERRSVA